jgi:protein arginine kinase activator
VKCDRCENEATVHEVRIENGKRREKHLCEQCAKSEGVAPQVPAPITALLQQFVTQTNPGAAGGETPGPAAKTAPCPACGTTYGQFRQTGLLGCPKCYEVFEAQLSPLIARAHEGGTRHVGKTPKAVPGGSRRIVGTATAVAAAPSPAPAPPTPAPAATAAAQAKAEQRAMAQTIAALKQQLADAVAKEEYEKAAKLRDELARLQNPPASGGTATAPESAPKRKPKASGEEGKA